MAGKRKISWFKLTAFVLAGILTGLTFGLILAVGVGLPEIRSLEDFEPGAASRILSADGQVLGELYVEKRLPLGLEEIPERLRQAVVAVEDRRYYRHPGIDAIRNVAALLHDLMVGRYEQGASTITQQLARNLFLTKEKRMTRKLKEIFLALQIESRYNKEEILELYLNQIPMGSGAYGMGAAADIYFGRDLTDLTLGEYALLAGLPQRPEGYNPFKRPDLALARRKIVLDAMVRNKYITREQAEAAKNEPLNLTGRTPSGRHAAPHFVRHVRSQLFERLEFDENQVYKGGLTIETTLNLKMQREAEAVLERGLERINRSSTRSSSESGSDGPVCGALVALEVGSGAVLAWVNQGDAANGNADSVLATPRPPGSAITPLIYAAALENGLTQADPVLDAPAAFPLPGRETLWRPVNFSRRFEGEITLRRALEISAVVPAVKILSRVGPDHFTETARNLGIETPMERSLELAVGAVPVRLIELSSAYAAFADQGIWSEPYTIARIKDRSGRVIYRASPKRRAVLSPETAYILTDMLEGAVTAGTAQRAQALKRPVAGKTGTTMDNDGALFIGYSPRLLAGVWIGRNSGAPLDPAQTAARSALPIWTAFMEEALTGKGATDFIRPVNIVMKDMDRYNGGPAEPGAPGHVRAAFRKSAPDL